MHEAYESPILDDPEWGFTSELQKAGRDELLEILSRFPIFEKLRWDELKEVELIVHRRKFVSNELVIRAWTPRSGLFVILSGSVNVVRSFSPGDSKVIGTLSAGELLGEFAILDDSPRSTSIVAAEPSELIGFFRPDLMDLIQTNPRVGFKILYRMSQIMSRRLTEVVENLRRLRMSLA